MRLLWGAYGRAVSLPTPPSSSLLLHCPSSSSWLFLHGVIASYALNSETQLPIVCSVLLNAVVEFATCGEACAMRCCCCALLWSADAALGCLVALAFTIICVACLWIAVHGAVSRCAPWFDCRCACPLACCSCSTASLFVLDQSSGTYHGKCTWRWRLGLWWWKGHWGRGLCLTVVVGVVLCLDDARVPGLFSICSGGSHRHCRGKLGGT